MNKGKYKACPYRSLGVGWGKYHATSGAVYRDPQSATLQNSRICNRTAAVHCR